MFDIVKTTWIAFSISKNFIDYFIIPQTLGVQEISGITQRFMQLFDISASGKKPAHSESHIENAVQDMIQWHSKKCNTPPDP